MATSTIYVLIAKILISALLIIAHAIRSYHRLILIPGSPLATVSRLWLLRGLLGTRNCLNFFETNLKYGPLARIGPNHLVTSDPELIHRMNAPRSTYHRGQWSTAKRFKPGSDNLLSERQEEGNEELRKKMAAGYAGKENPRMEKEIGDRIRDLISLIERKYICTDQEPGRQMDFGQKAQFFTLHVISALAFDQAFRALIVHEDNSDYIKTVEEAMPVIMMMTELSEVHSFFEKSLLMVLVVPSARDRFGFGKVITLAKEKVAESVENHKKVKQDMLGSFLRHGLN